MTDYLYSLTLAQQTKGFLLSLGFGFIMGIFYDLFRIIRICISRGKVAIIISDLLYCIFLCFCTFAFCLTMNEGEIRLYLLTGEAIGFAAYYFSLGAIIFSFSEILIEFIKKVCKWTFNAFSFPFRWLFEKLRVNFDKILKKSRKNGKKIKNKSKFLLKVNKHLLYNLFDNKQNPVDAVQIEREEVDNG